MAVITLKELVSLNRQCSSPLSNFQASERSIQQQFQQLVRQKRMGLNIKPLLNPQLAIWLEQLESFVPGIFDPRKKIYLDTRWQAQLQLEEVSQVSHWLEAPINAGVVKNKVRLYEWRIGSAELNWHDRVKLWVACNYLQYQPENLVMFICTFSPDRNHHINKYYWSREDCNAIEEELRCLLTKDPSAVTQNEVDCISEFLTNLDEIEEVKL